MPIPTWTDAQVMILKTMLENGAGSYADTAAAINAATGSLFTRNACIGKAKRLGLSGPAKQPVTPIVRRHRPIESSIHRILRKPAGQAEPDAFVARAADVVSRRVPLLDLRAMECRWPDDDRNEDGHHTFCGNPAADGSSYCGPHTNLSRGQGTASERAVAPVSKREAA